MPRRQRSCSRRRSRSPVRRDAEKDQLYLDDLGRRLQDHETRRGVSPAESLVLFNELLEAVHVARTLVPGTPSVLRMFALCLRRGAFNLSTVVRHLNALVFTREQLLDVYSLVGDVQDVRGALPNSVLKQAFDDLCLKWTDILEENNYR